MILACRAWVLGWGGGGGGGRLSNDLYRHSSLSDPCLVLVINTPPSLASQTLLLPFYRRGEGRESGTTRIGDR